MKIGYLTKRNAYSDDLLRELKKALPEDTLVEWLAGEDAPAADFEILLSLAPVSAKEMDTQPKLLLLQTISDGYDAVDVDAASDRGIWVGYSPAEETGNGVSVAEFAVLLLLAASRNLNEAVASITDKAVQRPMRNRALAEKTVCIVGYGKIAELIVERLRPFGVTITAISRSVDKVPDEIPTYPMELMHEGLKDADYVVVCVRGSKENEHLIDAAALAAMKSGATLINIARGSLVEEKALAVAVRSGHIAAAGLDVTEQEPIPAGDPLLSLPQVFLTPHVAGFTDLTLRGTTGYIAKVMAAFRAGRKMESLLNTPDKPRRVLG